MLRFSLTTVSRLYHHHNLNTAIMAAKKRIVWMDLEVLLVLLKSTCFSSVLVCLFLFLVTYQMTGLDDTKDHILEAACLVTDGDLNIVAEGPNLIINQPDSILDSMGEWCKKTHGEVSQFNHALLQRTYSLD